MTMQGAPDTRRRTLLRGGLLATAAATLPSFAAAATPPPRDDSAPLARVRSGAPRGYRDQDICVFKGIPYGGDTAARRFQAPLQETPWQDVRDASGFGAAAPQLKASEPTSEDCLFLNVWTPGLRDGGKRPVLFYIHGGGYTTGSGSDPLYDGVRLCKRGDVVVITVNHRLNLFGYLSLAQLGDASFADSGNAGQLDLIQALQWVRQHAAEFGGDAGNVTVFGQSGGGAKIATLMAMPAARGLFHRAWTMSGQQLTVAGPRAATQRAQLLLDALKMSPDEIAHMRTLPVAQLLAAAQVRDPSRVENSALYFGPVLDAQRAGASVLAHRAAAVGTYSDGDRQYAR